MTLTISSFVSLNGWIWRLVGTVESWCHGRDGLLPAENVFFVVVAGIGSPWEPGGALYTIAVPLEGTLSRMETGSP